MKIHRFYIKDSAISGFDPASLDTGSIFSVIDEKMIHQWVNVLRFEVGDQFAVFFSNGSEYDVVFTNIGKRNAEIKILSKKENANHGSRFNVVLASAVIRKERYEWLLEKGTELGVSSFYPIATERSEEKGYRQDRFEKIVIEAAEQSGRTNIPTVHSVMPLENVLKELKKEGYAVLVADFDGAPILSVLQQISTSQNHKVAFVIGPEGGWGNLDAQAFANFDIVKVKMGNTVLRAETAALVAASSVLIGEVSTK